MVKIIKSKQELMDLAKDYLKVQIIGEGWVGQLIVCFFKKYIEKEIQYIKIDGIDNIDKKLIDENLIIIQEDREEINNKLIEYGVENIFCISNIAKNEIDVAVMSDYPDIYEKEVLISRKKEMDKKMHIKFLDNIRRLLNHEIFPIFQSIEIETINRCNGECSFCPINRNEDSRIYAKMDEKLFESIILQLASIQYKGRVSLFSNNEPLLDKRIVNFAKFTYEQLPDACKLIYTNGTLLNKDIFFRLMEYLNILCIDVYYDDNIYLELTNELIEIFKCCLMDINLQKKVMVQFINRKAIRNNRGGQSKNRHNIYQVKATCMLPYVQMIVRPDGKLSLCCNDALGRYTLGDLNKEGLIEAWNNKNYKNIRERIYDSRQNIEFCKYCDNYASSNVKGNNFFSKKQFDEAWTNVEKILCKS